MIWGRGHRHTFGEKGGEEGLERERPLIGIETISRRFGSRSLDGVNVISPKLTILRGGNEAIQWMGGRGWAEFGRSLTIIRCPFFPLCVLICFYPPSIDSALIQIEENAFTLRSRSNVAPLQPFEN